MKSLTTSTALDSIKATSKRVKNSVASNPMTLVYGVLGVASLFLLYKVGRTAGNALDSIKDDPNAGGGNFDNGNPSEVKDGATITLAQAQTSAAILLEAMHTIGGVSRSEFERIKNVFKGRTIQDYVLMSKAFGEPRRSIITGESSVLVLGGVKMNLSQWLAKELDDEQIDELSLVIPGVF
ncbi:hypothetical protein [Flagellimonas marina]|uniref:DUF4359 domain-containing protein n=1 Tax=Flagellimonas marina TaxID=1775168 RepID=A0ABV8PFP6_9FLAO